MGGLGDSVRRFGDRFQLTCSLALGGLRFLTGFPPPYNSARTHLKLLRDLPDLLAFLNQLQGLCLLVVGKFSAGGWNLLHKFLRGLLHEQSCFLAHSQIFEGWKAVQCRHRRMLKATFRYGPAAWAVLLIAA